MRARLLVAGPVAIVASLVLAASASASGFFTAEVTSTADDHSMSACTLRDAVTAATTGITTNGCTASVTGSSDKVTFDESALAGQPITLTLGEISLNDSDQLDLIGDGRDETIIASNSTSRVFSKTDPPGANKVEMESLTIRDGKVTSSTTAKGGCVNNVGTMNLIDVRLTNCTVDADRSGGFADATADGAAIYNEGSLSVADSLVDVNHATADNTADTGGQADARGAIYSKGSSGVTLTDTTVSDNDATAHDPETDGDFNFMAVAAGIANDSSAQIDISGSTISGNAASGTEGCGNVVVAGGLYTLGPGNIELTTVADNIADGVEQGGCGALFQAGGIYEFAGFVGTLWIRSSTIARNGPLTATDVYGANYISGAAAQGTKFSNTIIADPRGGGGNCIYNQPPASGGFNDDYSPAGPSCFNIPGPTDLAVDPQLSPLDLQPNGGPTNTIALERSSPVIDQGSDADQQNPGEDQRGFDRPADFPGLPMATGGNRTDIGAFEVQQACPPFVQSIPLSHCPGDPGNSVQVTDNDDDGNGCGLREALATIGNPTSPTGTCTVGTVTGNDRITFAPGIGDEINLDTGELNVNDPLGPLDIVGPGIDNLEISAADDSRVMNEPGTNTVTISGMGIAGGSLSGADALRGGCILNSGTLTLTNVRVHGCSIDASSNTTNAYADGAGIGSQGTLILNNSQVDNNQATADNQTTGAGSTEAQARGGGIYSEGAGGVTINDSTIAENEATATDADDAASNATAAGGLAVVAGGGPNISRSTFELNKGTATEANGTAQTGGGIYSTVTGNIELSTVVRNRGDVTGPVTKPAGGIFVNGGGLSIRSSSIALNGPTSSTPTDGANFISNIGGSTFSNTILADPRGDGDNCLIIGGSITSAGFNDDYSANPTPTNPCFSSPMASDLTTDPLFTPAGPQDNGGPTMTMGLDPASPVIDKGLNAGITLSPPTQDQRGLTRPVAFPGLPQPMGGNRTDIGSLEVQQACSGGFIQSTPLTPCPPPPPPPSGGGDGGTTTTPTAAAPGPTGQRAAALSKCKKKKSKAKRKKCKKRANLLPG